MNEIGIALLWCMVQVTVLSFLAAGIYALARRFGPRIGGLVALTSMALIVGLTILAFSPWPRWTLVSASSTEAAAISTPSGLETELKPTPDSSISDTEQIPPATEINVDIASTPADQPALAPLWHTILEEISRASAPADPVDRPVWPKVLAGLVLLGAVLGMVRLVSGMLVVTHYRRQSVPVSDARISETLDLLLAELGCRRRPEMRESDAFFSAATVGWRRPVILLPTAWRAWNNQQLRAVLAHEIAHIQGNDFLAALLAQIGLALHFYHPVVHWLVARLRLEQELAADGIAAEVTGGRRPYLTTLATMAIDQEDRNVVWPARAFLPAKTTFLRRIVVLRNYHTPVRVASRSIRVLAVTCMVLAGIFVAGLRPRAADQAVAQAPDQEVEVTQPIPTGTIDMSYVPEDADLVIAFRPAAILERAKQIGVEELARALFRNGGPFAIPHGLGLGLEIEEIEQLTACFTLPDPFDESAVLLRVVKATQLSELISESAAEKRFLGKTYFVSNRHAYLQLDDHTITMFRLGSNTSLQRFLATRPGKGPAFLTQETWKSFMNDYGVIVYSQEAVSTLNTMTSQDSPFPATIQAIVLGPPMDEVKDVLLGLRLDDHLGAHAIISCKSDDGAAKVQETLDAYKVLYRNTLVGQSSRHPSMTEVHRVLAEFFASVKIEQTGSTLNASGAVLIENDWPKRFAAQINAASQGARRLHSSNNLKQLALAMHNYHDTYKSFPPAVLYGPDGKTPYSWRVAILPFAGQQELYDRYRFDESWDGPNNRKLLDEIPPMFRHPDAPADSQNSSYFALIGPETMFSGKGDEPRQTSAGMGMGGMMLGSGLVSGTTTVPEKVSSGTKGASIRDITDGTSNTLLFVEAKRNIPWTKPEDIPYSADQPIPELGGFTEGGFQVAFCDGSVRFLKETLPEKTLRALISIAGGETINRDEL